jgi:hypothetical protein
MMQDKTLISLACMDAGCIGVLVVLKAYKI